ncbi:helix-turn-helix domain-containing protein [Streptomyces venezuelae]|uniref:helix-turn-helix domain-containing protein n=1 Tax=Streptomyces venezuelae TaxID=54571 RepID=UPI00278BC628|nr:helix-turn-helix domain-containing protein [Streptomyces venezuelae]
MADPQSNAAPSAYPAILVDAPPSGVIHIRHRHTERFTVVGNHLAQHAELSAAAIGIAVYIQSLPDGVSVTAKALALHFSEGETTIRRALNELERAGYIARPRVPLGGGRFATRTFSYDKPGCVPESKPKPRPKPAPAQAPAPVSAPVAPPGDSQAQPSVRPAPPQSPTGPAVDLLARLRLADPRLLLSAGDVQRLAPAVEIWLSRAATPAQITRTLTANLPPEPVPIHHPARFLEYRLGHLLPPSLPVEEPRPPGPAPLVTCDGCERAFRSHDPEASCGECREAVVA